MEYKLLENDGKIVLYFDKIEQDHIISLFKLIRYNFCKDKPVNFLISINGLEPTLDYFIESCTSNNYYVYDNGRYNLFVKNLPTLYMLTDEWNDVINFCQYIGCFNEGQMSLLFVDVNYSFDFHNNKKCDFSTIEAYYKVDVLSDGEEFEIEKGFSTNDFKDEYTNLKTLIQSWKQNTEPSPVLF